MTTEQNILPLIANTFLTTATLANQLNLSKAEISKAITNLRKSGTNIIASRPGPKGGYLLVTSKSVAPYTTCKTWVINWRISNNITPTSSTFL